MKKLFLTTALIAATGFAGTALAEHHEMKKDGYHAEKEKVVDKNIVEKAMSKDKFSTLVTALKAADLVDALSGEGPFTVFAPTNEAFAKLPEGAVADLLKPENKEKLQAVLKYHVVSGKIMAEDIADGTTDVTTLQGTTASVVKSEDGVMVDGATVTYPNVKTTNGVIHVIDTVIMP